MASGSETYEDPNRVVIPVDDSKSDGDKARWPVNNTDSRWIYRMRDDESWRIGLAEMWVEKQMGIQEEGKRATVMHLFICQILCLLAFMATWLFEQDVGSRTQHCTLCSFFQPRSLLAENWQTLYPI